jgi:hypothetical protein
VPILLIDTLRKRKYPRQGKKSLFCKDWYRKFHREPLLSIIASANVNALILDISSVLLDEYQMSHAMIDLPIEVASLMAISIVRMKIRKDHKNKNGAYNQVI